MANLTAHAGESGVVASGEPDPERFVVGVPESRVRIEYSAAWDRYRGYARLAKSQSIPPERREISARRAEYWHQVAELLDRRLP